MGNGNRVKKRREVRDGEVARLKNALRRLESDKRKLLSEIKTLEAAFQHTVTFLRGKTKDLSVEELIAASNRGDNLSQIEHKKEHTLEDMIKRWECHKCTEGVMKLVIFENRTGKQYFRSCTCCKNRTIPKPYTESVTGIRDEHIKKNKK